MASVLVLIPILLLQYNSVIAHTGPVSNNLFAADLLSVISENKTQQNIVYSPASIYAALALTYLGAKGHTAEEIRNTLKLGQADKLDFAAQYGDYFRTTFKKGELRNNAPRLVMINRLFVNSSIAITQQFSQTAENSFGCQAKNVDFSKALPAVKMINAWVEQHTENKIRNLMRTDAVNKDTSAVLVNAIHFNARWLRPFSLSYTRPLNFYINHNKKVKVNAMFGDNVFGYVELRHLKAKAIEMPYANSDISMLIILPNEIDGLKTLEDKLKGVDLNNIISKMVLQNIIVALPKFRIEFDIDLKRALMKLGCSSMFSKDANLSGMFANASTHISAIKHKAFLDVNEAGSEAAASSYEVFSSRMFKKVFRADHPFFFAIRSKSTVFFAGHMAKF